MAGGLPDGSPRSKAFDFAQETTKQLLTLSSGIIAVTVTFIGSDLKKFSSAAQILLEVSWLLYLLCILFGVFTLMSLSGNLERPGPDGPSIYAGPIKMFAVLEVLAFVLALGFTVAFGFAVA